MVRGNTLRRSVPLMVGLKQEDLEMHPPQMSPSLRFVEALYLHPFVSSVDQVHLNTLNVLFPHVVTELAITTHINSSLSIKMGMLENPFSFQIKQGILSRVFEITSKYSDMRTIVPAAVHFIPAAVRSPCEEGWKWRHGLWRVLRCSTWTRTENAICPRT